MSAICDHDDRAKAKVFLVSNAKYEQYSLRKTENNIASKGHGDAAYIARRKFLNDQAMEYRHGEPIPYVDYSKEEHETWRVVYEKLRNLRESHACYTYRKNLKLLEDEGVLSPNKIPQIRDVNKYLQSKQSLQLQNGFQRNDDFSEKTGFILRPCSGLLSARDFLASLAFRVFQTTTYLRHGSKPHHSPEPDLIHELLGHVPMFADPLVAQMSQDIGLMSLGATDEQIEKLATVYWFIIEFGLCREGGQLKAIGAGLLSAYGELMHACSDKPEHRDFDPAIQDSDYQPLYFVAQSIEDALSKLREYARSFERPFAVVYDPFTRSVEVRDLISLDPIGVLGEEEKAHSMLFVISLILNLLYNDSAWNSALPFVQLTI
ncbi:Biopterin-dependent aromatic amino acid hydroxylase [Cooperia oncophora]